MLEKYAEVCSGIKHQIKKINSGKLGKHGKEYMKTKFDSDDDLPLNKILKFRILTIIIRTIFEEDDKYYSQVFLDDYLYEISMVEYDRIDISEGIDINKTKNASRECDIRHYWYF